jgi:hypothetical protein
MSEWMGTDKEFISKKYISFGENNNGLGRNGDFLKICIYIIDSFYSTCPTKCI